MEHLPFVAALLALLAPAGAGIVSLIKHLASVWLRVRLAESTGRDPGPMSDVEPESSPNSTAGPHPPNDGADGSRPTPPGSSSPGS